MNPGRAPLIRLLVAGLGAAAWLAWTNFPAVADAPAQALVTLAAGEAAVATSTAVDVESVETNPPPPGRPTLGEPSSRSQPRHTVTSVPPQIRTRLGLSAVYQQCINADGLPIVASPKARPEALLEAAYVIDCLLDGRDDLRRAISAAKVRVSIMAATEFTTDVPEHADLKPASYWNRRARGLGATTTRPSVSCGEENLLTFPGDPYAGENILIHEFAHTIHEIALQAVDPTFDARLQTAYERARSQGLWKNAYAATNRHEYWAEGVQSWFDCNRPPDAVHNGVRTRAALLRYDPELAKLLQEVFRGNSWRYTAPRARTDAQHLTNLDWTALPKFTWPANGTLAPASPPVPAAEISPP